MATTLEPAAVGRMTAEAFAVRPWDATKCELVRGELRPISIPFPRHGQLCSNIAYLLRLFCEQHTLGRVLSNDSGVVTERDPDSVRGADVAFYSYARVPVGRIAPGAYLGAMPEVVFEVRSWTDRWADIHEKIGEYLAAGVGTVVVLDDRTEQIFTFPPGDDGVPRIFAGDVPLELPAPLDGWRVPARRFFE